MKKKISRILKFIISSVPYVLGVTGFLMNGSRVTDALYTSISLYAMKAPSPTPNLLVEIARWTAPMITASGILLLVSTIWSRLHAWVRYQSGDSVAVYGPEEKRRAMLEKLDSCGVEGKDKFVRAHRYLLLGSEKENLDFYAQHRDALIGKPVYLQCSSLPIQSASDPDLRLFCPEETAARQYWKERGLFETSMGRGHRLKVVFLGFGRLGRELITFGLQDNIFHPDQRIEYHIFGDGTAFSATHPQLSQISDPVIFHEKPWYTDLSLLEEADRLIVLTQEEQLSLLRELLLSTTRREIDVFSADTGWELLAEHERLRPYAWQNECRLPERIFSDKLYERAKKLNLRYAALYFGAEETDSAREEEWRKLDTFTRYSNISSADYHEIRLQMLQSLGKTPQDCMDFLSELEHIRWCRYHYLNNWRHGVPEDGKAKDPARKLHKDLVPYSELTEEEKKKDTDSINVLLSVI